MKLLKDLANVKEGSDLSRLPPDVISAIKSNIRKGAGDFEQKWANALELVHKAYEVEGAARPTPDMDAAWKQYEENLQYAVQQLANARGMDDDWRMSSSIFHEALQPKHHYRVTVDDDSYIVEGDDVVSIITQLSEAVPDHETNYVVEDDHYVVSFSKWGIKHRTKLIVENA